MEEHIKNMKKLIELALSQNTNIALDAALLVLAYAVRDLAVRIQELEKHEV